MISGQTLSSIAQLTRVMIDKEAKAIVVSNWEKIKTLSEWNAKKLIDLICDEDIHKLKKFFVDLDLW